MNSAMTEPMATAPTNRRRDRLILGGLLALFAVGLLGLVTATGWKETMAQLSKLTVPEVLGLLALSLVNYLFRALRWHLLGTKLGTGLRVRTNFLHFLGGFAMSITPGRIGELVRLRWMSRLSGWSFARLTPLPLADRAYDLAAMGLVLAGSAVMSQTGTVGAVPVAVLAIASAVVVTRPALLDRLVTGLWKLIGKAPRFFVRLRQAASSMGAFSSPGLAISSMSLSVIGWLAEGYALYLLLMWMGADISLAMAITIFTFSTLAGGLTGAPGGIGGAEAAMVVLLGLNGVPLEIAVPATAVIRLTTLWFAIAIGVVLFPVAEQHSKRG